MQIFLDNKSMNFIHTIINWKVKLLAYVQTLLLPAFLVKSVFWYGMQVKFDSEVIRQNEF